MLKIALISDLHLGPAGYLHEGRDHRARFLMALEEARACSPDAYFFMGDYSLAEPDPKVIQWLKEELSSIDQPIHWLAGNHDETGQLRSVLNLSIGSADTLDYTYQIGNLDIIVLDSSQKRLKPEQLIWLERQLELAQNPTLFIHHPPILMGAKFMDSRHALENHTELTRVLLDYGKPIFIFCGHYHSALTTTFENLTVCVVPPTSFSISPTTADFEYVPRPPAFQILMYENGRFTAEVKYCEWA
ncbi:MAG: metallophosphoesterase [Bacteroidota bacterium]